MKTVHMMTTATVANGKRVVETVCAITLELPTGKPRRTESFAHDVTGWRSRVTCTDCVDVLDRFQVSGHGS